MAGEKSEPHHRKMTPLDYAKARRLYEMGTATLAELAEQFGVHPSSLHERFKRDGVVKGSRVSEALEKMDEVIANDAEQLMKRVTDTKEQHYRYAEALSKMTMQAIIDTRQKGKPIAAADGDLAALNKAAKTLEVLRKERYKLLGLDDDGGDPNENEEILISEMTDEQIDELRQAANPNVDNSEGIESLLEDIDIVDEGLEGLEQ